MERSYTNQIGPSLDGKEVLLKGWVHELRDLSKVKFLILRDITGLLQCVVDIKNKKVCDIYAKLTKESVVGVTGKVKVMKQAPKGVEIDVTNIEIINLAESMLPIQVNEKGAETALGKRLDYRFLDMHKPKIQAIFKVQNTIANAFREYFYNKKYIEMQPPCIISAASEGGTDLFSVRYFEKKAYLAQSPQLYKQMVACSMEKTFMITPVWRAEKHNTPRHLNEIRQMDIEVAFMDQMGIMKELEGVVRHIVKKVLENCKEELESLNVKNLKVPNGVYLSYDEAIKKAGGKIGEDFTPEQEKKLNDMYSGNIIFTYSWPSSIKPFYIMTKDAKKDSEYSEGFDAIYGGMEICSGGQRIHLPELLIERLKVKGLKPEDFKDYITSFRYGACPHAGWSIGLERLTQIICGLDNVKEACFFPRDRDRLTP